MLSLLVISGLVQSPDRCVSHAFRSLRPMGILNGFNTRTVKVVEQRLIVVSVFQLVSNDIKAIHILPLVILQVFQMLCPQRMQYQ